MTYRNLSHDALSGRTHAKGAVGATERFDPSACATFF
jgi:hypothetical protein